MPQMMPMPWIFIFFLLFICFYSFYLYLSAVFISYGSCCSLVTMPKIVIFW